MKKILCRVFGHRLFKVRSLSIGGDLCLCVRCGDQICVHHGRRQAIPYDDDVRVFEKQVSDLIDKYMGES